MWLCRHTTVRFARCWEKMAGVKRARGGGAVEASHRSMGRVERNPSWRHGRM